MASFTVKTEGFDTAQAGMAEIASDAEGMALEVAEIVAELIVSQARPNVPVRSGKAASSLRGYATNEGAVAEGGEGVEYYAWLEYGGTSGRGGSNVRETVTNGRYIYPAYQDAVDLVEAEMLKGLNSLIN